MSTEALVERLEAVAVDGSIAAKGWKYVLLATLRDVIRQHRLDERSVQDGAGETGIGNHARTAHQQDHALTPSARTDALVQRLLAHKFPADMTDPLARMHNGTIDECVLIVREHAAERPARNGSDGSG